MLEKTLGLLAKIPAGTYVSESETVFDSSELSELAGLLNRLLYSPSCLRGFLQSKGVTITPSNYYSEIPKVEEIEKSFSGGGLRYCEELFDKQRLDGFLNEIFPYSFEFDPPIKPDKDGKAIYSWEGGMYSYSDAMSYYCIARHTKPKNIMEIGSGFSSMIALEALSKNGSGRLTCIDPHPQGVLRKIDGLNLLEKKAQDIDADFVNDVLGDGDILFIDSTHTVKHGSDCLHIYLNLLPKIKNNINVHVHDVFLPFTLPIRDLRDKQIYWTEQYLLAAYLIDNPKAQVFYSSSFAYHFSLDLLEKLMHGRYGAGGASLWFHLKGRCSG